MWCNGNKTRQGNTETFCMFTWLFWCITWNKQINSKFLPCQVPVVPIASYGHDRKKGKKMILYNWKNKTQSKFIYTRFLLIDNFKLLFYSIFPQWEMCELLLLLLGLEGSLVFGEGTSHGTGFLWPEVKGFKFLWLVELAQVLTLSMADNSQNSGNRFSNKFAVKERNHMLKMIN